MAAPSKGDAPKDEPKVAAKPKAEPASEVVLAPFAFAKKPNGEEVMLAKGDHVDAERFTKERLDHLRSIGFIGHN